MNILFAALLILLVALAATAVALLLQLRERPSLSPEQLPRPASPEALDAAERRLAERFAELDRSSAQRDKNQRDELGRHLGENAKRLSDSLRDLYTRLEAVGSLKGSFDRLDEGVKRFNAILSNVKVRGTWAEVQLETLLEDILAPGQFARNVKPNPRSSKIVEFALALPGQEEGKTVWVPIDSKFPLEDYERLLAAENPATAEAERRNLANRLKTFAGQVAEYVTPPYTTPFAILFLPTDGLYLEVSRDASLLEEMRRRRLMLAGPQTLAALLNALSLGFQSLAIQRNAAKAWDLLAKAKRHLADYLGECDKLDKALDNAQKAADQARSRIDLLGRTLRTVELPEERASSDA